MQKFVKGHAVHSEDEHIDGSPAWNWYDDPDTYTIVEGPIAEYRAALINYMADTYGLDAEDLKEELEAGFTMKQNEGQRV